MDNGIGVSGELSKINAATTQTKRTPCIYKNRVLQKCLYLRYFSANKYEFVCECGASTKKL